MEFWSFTVNGVRFVHNMSTTMGTAKLYSMQRPLEISIVVFLGRILIERKWSQLFGWLPSIEDNVHCFVSNLAAQ